MPVPVISISQMREWEKATWADGETEAEVIRRVGKKLARRVRRLTSVGDRILVLAGKGHNGDDARAAAEHLENRRVDLLEVLLPQSDLLPIEMALKKKPVLVVDGLFGIGLSRPLGENWQKIIAAVNASKIPVLAVDVPSGLNADTGEALGAAIEAAVTLTVGAPKNGLLAPAALRLVGRLEIVEDVGLVPCPHGGELQWVLPGDFENFPPRRPVVSNKGSYGHLAVVAGSFGYHGASILATHAAQRAHPGLVTLFTQENVFQPVAAQLQSAMVNIWKPELKLPEKTSAVLIGPGLAALSHATELKAFTRHLWHEASYPVVVDASALDLLESGGFPADAIRVLTPHPGEAARLLGTAVADVQGNRVQALRNLSKKFGGCWVVLKGHQTLTGRAEGPVLINSSGNPHLAQGGTGDVLGGFLAGLLAQPELQNQPAQTISFAVWQHGAAADQLEARRANWIVEDLVAELGNV
jgi:NAD(P)H-hydrate epimerase